MIKLGILAQGQAEWDDAADAKSTSQNLYLRRFRILFGGQITNKLSFFFETDSPNLGKYDPAAGKKVAGDVYIQDFFATYSFSDELKIDGGLILIPASHNSEQSAATLLPVDYGPYSFLGSAPTDSNMGRDYGVQARGYPLDKHLEYRLGVFDGQRDMDQGDDDPASR